MGVKLFLVIALAGPLVACAVASDISMQQLSKDLIAAEASKCQNLGTLLRRVDCLNSVERPIWAREAPGTLDLYLHSNAEREAIATRYDSRTLSAENTKAAMTAVRTELWRLAVHRQQAKDAESAASARATQETINNVLGAFILGGAAFLSGYNHGAGYDQPPAPIVTTSCTTLGAVTNCLSP